MDTTALAERLAQEIRRVDGSHSLGAAALAEALVPFVESLRAVAGEPAWPSEAKRADDGDGWAAISLGVLHRMSADQARVWNGCRAACIASYTRPQPATPASGEVAGLREAMHVIADRITTRADAYFGRTGESDVQRMGFRSYAVELRALANTLPTPATVTDEDVERAQEAADLVFAKHFGTRPNADEIDTAMTRAALESFANKETTDE